mgnify:CR=1 FL=1
MSLSSEQLNQYEQDGFLCPVDVFGDFEAARLRRELEGLEARASAVQDNAAALRNNSHWVAPWFDDLIRDPNIINPIASILGPNLLVLSVDLFIKEPQEPKFISWHQDLHYWGLDSEDEVTAWLALTPATLKSGCMRYLPGSHKTIVEHQDTFAAENMLTRGQEVTVEVDESEAVAAELQPGQMSLHHGRLFHASAANESCDRRIGIAIRYISPSVGLANNGVKLGASLVHGEDTYGHFDLVRPPTRDFDPISMKNWKRLRGIQEEILFAGVNREAS